MTKGHAYFELLEALKESGCPVCNLVLKDSRRYLDHLLYESVLDVPIRMELIESFGFCSWHTWQLPSLPAICSPDTGFSIFASDLLRKFNFLAHDMAARLRTKRTFKSLFTKISQRFVSTIKEKACPACRHVAQFESYHLNNLTDFVRDEEFLQAYKASPGICLLHFFLLEKSYSAHPNFPLLLELQLSKSQSLRDTLEEFIRKQDHRFRDQITPEEARAWRMAMEFLVGKPGIFANEMGHDLLKARTQKISMNQPIPTRLPFERLTFREFTYEIKAAKEVTFYLKKPLPADLFQGLKEFISGESPPTIEAVVGDFTEVGYLREFLSAGFSLYYGIGLPSQTIVFLDQRRGYLLEDHHKSLRPLKNAENLYFSLLWHRFGHAVLLSGLVKEKDLKGCLFCLAVEGGREQWCRLRDPSQMDRLQVGAEVELFCWERWITQVLEVLQVTVLKDGETSPLNLQEAKEGGK